jgi:NAD(P)-dependent dehydrogenase (short-subunit alcohol dehydrogenase family)
MELAGQTALITGGAVRLGRALALALGESGARIVIHYRASADEARSLADELRGRGTDAFLVQADLRSEAACRSVIAESVALAGQLDILVNNAAVFHKDRIADADEATVLGEFWPNLFAPLFLIRAFAATAERGRILNLLDRRITSHDPDCVPYLLSKKGLEELTYLAAQELAPGFTVNAVAPGALLPPPGEDDGYLAEHGGPVPLGVACTPDHVCDAARYLLSSDVLTGQVVFVDGGQHLV